MNKSFRHIFHGEQGTGKTNFAKGIAERYEDVHWIDGSNEYQMLGSSFASAYRWNCKLMIIDNVRPETLLFLTSIFYHDDRPVDRQGVIREVFARPHVIIIVDEELDERKYGATLLRRFQMYRFVKKEVADEQG